MVKRVTILLDELPFWMPDPSENPSCYNPQLKGCYFRAEMFCCAVLLMAKIYRGVACLPARLTANEYKLFQRAF